VLNAFLNRKRAVYCHVIFCDVTLASFGAYSNRNRLSLPIRATAQTFTAPPLSDVPRLIIWFVSNGCGVPSSTVRSAFRRAAWSLNFFRLAQNLINQQTHRLDARPQTERPKPACWVGAPLTIGRGHARGGTVYQTKRWTSHETPSLSA
jgi:hypothetical protein